MSATWSIVAPLLLIRARSGLYSAGAAHMNAAPPASYASTTARRSTVFWLPVTTVYLRPIRRREGAAPGGESIILDEVTLKVSMPVPAPPSGRGA